MPNSSTKPRQDFHAITQMGHKALLLAKRDRERIEARLPSGRLDELEADLTALGDDRVAVQTTMVDGQRATATQDTKAAEAMALISAVRQNLLRRKAPKDVRVAFGLHKRFYREGITSIVAAGQNILNAARADAETARHYGLLASDLEHIEQRITALRAADDTQEAIIAARPMTTAQRNRRARNILAAVREISGAGCIEYALEPPTRAEYEALFRITAPSRQAPRQEAPPEEPSAP